MRAFGEESAGGGVPDRDLDDAFDPGGGGRVDGGAELADHRLLAVDGLRAGAVEEQPVDALEGGGERGGVVEVADHVVAAQRAALGAIAHQGAELDVCFDELVDQVASDGARGAGHQNHGMSLPPDAPLN